MQRDSAAEYFFSLTDDALSVIKNDPLREVVRPYSYRIENEEAVKLDSKLDAIINAGSGNETAAEAKRENAKTPRLSFLRLNDLLQDCHACDSWLNRNERTEAGHGALKPIFVFVLDRVAEDGSFMSANEEVFFSKWLAALHLDARKECYFTSVIKCPSSGGYIPQECENILIQQLEALRPAVVMMLGSAGALITTGSGDIFKAREKIHDYHGFRTVCSFSPSQVLEDYQSLRRPIWEDLTKAARIAGIDGRLS